MNKVRELEEYLNVVVGEIPQPVMNLPVLNKTEAAELTRNLLEGADCLIDDHDWAQQPSSSSAPPPPLKVKKKEFSRAISRVFDSFLGSWYMEQET